MRLSSYPFVTVRVACSRCSRHGSYRLARLADRYGAETTLLDLMDMLAADCRLREGRRANVYDRCGACFPDIGGSRSPASQCRQSHACPSCDDPEARRQHDAMTLECFALSGYTGHRETV